MSGNIYITGVTGSSNFPVTTGAIQTVYGGLQDAFVTKISNQESIVYSTYLGGSTFDWGSGIAVDTAGNAYVTGYTSSLNFPTTGQVQPTFNGAYDAFVSMLNTTGGVLVFLLTSEDRESIKPMAISVDSSGNMYIGGQTNSTNLPTQTPYQSANSGGAIGWVAGWESLPRNRKRPPLSPCRHRPGAVRMSSSLRLTRTRAAAPRSPRSVFW